MQVNDATAHWAFLTKRKKRWRRLPASIRDEVSLGVKKVGRIRAQIGANAAVKVMPPVEIFDEIWVMPNCEWIIDGRASLVTIDGRTLFGAQLPATTILLPSDTLIRAILVHEFAHCFHFTTQAIDALDSGRLGEGLRLGANYTGDFADRAQDDALLVNPAEWFGQSDAESLLAWDDSRFTKAVQQAQVQIICRLKDYLPMKTPTSGFAARGIAYDLAVADHIRKLRGRAGGS